MDNSTKLKGMLGLASKARSLIFGTELVSDAVRHGRCNSVFAASDASANTMKRIRKYCRAYNADLFLTGLSKSELAGCVGKKNDLSITATVNDNFAKAIADLCEKEKSEETEIYSDNTRTNAGGTI